VAALEIASFSFILSTANDALFSLHSEKAIAKSCFDAVSPGFSFLLKIA